MISAKLTQLKCIVFAHSASACDLWILSLSSFTLHATIIMTLKFMFVFENSWLCLADGMSSATT